MARHNAVPDWLTPNATLLLTAVGGGAVALGLFGVVFNLYVLAAGRTSADLGLVLSTGTLGAALAVIPAGLASDAWGRRPTFVIGGAIAGITTFAQCSVTALAPLILFGVISGAASAAIGVVALPALADSAPTGRAPTLMAVAGALGLIGTTGGSALAGWLPARIVAVALARGVSVDSLTAYRATLYLGVAVGGAAVLPALCWFRDVHEPIGIARAVAAARAGLELRGSGGPYLLVNVALGFGAGWILPYLNVYLIHDDGFSLAAYGLLAAIGTVVQATATVATPLLARRFGLVRTVAIGQLLSLPCMAVLGASHDRRLVATAYCLRLSLMDGGTPAVEGWVFERLPAGQRGVYSSLLAMAFQMPWAVTSALGGSLQTTIGARPLFLFTGLCYLPGVALFWLAYRRTAEMPAVA